LISSDLGALCKPPTRAMLLIGFAGMLLEALRRNKAAGRNDHCLAD
jgi:hypothetical protein